MNRLSEMAAKGGRGGSLVKNRTLALLGTCLASATGILGLIASPAAATTFVTIQPHAGGTGYVVTYSWQDGFANGMDGGSNGSNAYIDDNTTTVSSNYQMTSGNHVNSLIRYSQHNNDGVNGNFFQVPAAASGVAVHYDGTDGESLTPGDFQRESSHSNVGLVGGVNTDGDWYNNPNDFGGVRFFGTGVQGAQSLTSWNGVDSSSAWGNVVVEGNPLLGDAMQFGVNGSSPGATDSLRVGMAFDAAYANANIPNGLLMGFFPYASTFPNVAPGADLFLDQFNLGTYVGGNDITLTIVNDPNFVPLLVSGPAAAIPEPSSLALLGLGLTGLIFRRRRRRR